MIREYEGTSNERTSFEEGDMVVVCGLNDLVGELGKLSYDEDGISYRVFYTDGACEWCEYEDLREANDLDDWSLSGRKSMFGLENWER